MIKQIYKMQLSSIFQVFLGYIITEYGDVNLLTEF